MSKMTTPVIEESYDSVASSSIWGMSKLSRVEYERYRKAWRVVMDSLEDDADLETIKETHKYIRNIIKELQSISMEK